MYTRSNSRDEGLIISKKLFYIQDKNVLIELKLLYYIKSIPIAMCNNIYTPIGLMNRIRYISMGIVSDDNDIFYFQLVNNQVINCINKISTKCKYNFV